MSSINQAAGGCGCPGPGACASPTILGRVTNCGGLAVAGIAVEARDSTAGGTLLGSTATDAGGNYTLSGLVGCIAGNAIVVAMKHPRLATATRTLTFAHPTGGFNTRWDCGATTATASTSMATPAAGYHCLNGCAIPIADTLTLTDSVYGGATLTFAAGVWGGSAGGSFGGTGVPCGDCPPGGVTIFYTLDPATAQLQVSVTGGPPGCPGPGPGSAGALPIGIGTPTCPPAFMMSSTVPSFAWTGAIIEYLYQCADVTFTITE